MPARSRQDVAQERHTSDSASRIVVAVTAAFLLTASPPSPLSQRDIHSALGWRLASGA
jgi:hypothetical protein